jgi:hypothetical protein
MGREGSGQGPYEKNERNELTGCRRPSPGRPRGPGVHEENERNERLRRRLPPPGKVPRAGTHEKDEMVTGHGSRVTSVYESIKRRSDFSDASVDPTEARCASSEEVVRVRLRAGSKGSIGHAGWAWRIPRDWATTQTLEPPLVACRPALGRSRIASPATEPRRGGTTWLRSITSTTFISQRANIMSRQARLSPANGNHSCGLNLRSWHRSGRDRPGSG